MRVLLEEDGRTLCESCVLADRPVSRAKGLLGRRELPPGEGIVLRPAASIHTFFMRFPIDVVFVDGDDRVLRVVANVPPWRAVTARGARAVLELSAGECDRRGVRAGDRLVYVE